MPTVVLLDRSLSMRRPAGRGGSKDAQDEETLHDLACKGLEWFFNYMGEYYSLEYTSLFSFSSECEILVPFTRDYDQLKEKLTDLSVQDRTDLGSALVSMVDLVVAEWGSFAPCQVVVITDGSPGVRHQDAAQRKPTANIPFSYQLHVVCIATRDELAQPLWASKMQKLCDTTGLSPAEIHVPNSPLNVDSVIGAFAQLAKNSFRPYLGTLKCGHLQSQVSLSPSPYMHRPKFDISIGPDHKFPKLDESFGAMKYPQELRICGFLDTSCLSAPPHYARHFVLDPEIDEKIYDAQLTRLVEGRSGRTKSESEAPSLQEESQKPSFRVLLHGSLKCESKSALVKLGEKWYGLLFSQLFNSKKSNLVLCVFYPNSEVPWLGPISYLGNKQPTVMTDPRVAQQTPGDMFPVGPPRPPSFNSPSNLLWAKETVLQADVSKVVRYSRKLPDKESSLIKELNKLRMVAITYHIPDLLEILCQILSREETSPSSNPQAKGLLQNCLYFLRNNKNPQERLVIQ